MSPQLKFFDVLMPWRSGSLVLNQQPIRPDDTRCRSELIPTTALNGKMGANAQVNVGIHSDLQQNPVNPNVSNTKNRVRSVVTIPNNVLRSIAFIYSALSCASSFGPRYARTKMLPACWCVFFFMPPVLADQPSLHQLDHFITTRAERAQLDAQREQLNAGQGINTTTRITIASGNVEMQGIMQREKGKAVTWINGQSTINSNRIGDNIQITGQPQAWHGASVKVDGQTIRLKPGQVWQPDKHEINEVYKTKVATPMTSGAGENVEDVQTEINAAPAASSIVKQ